MPADIATVNVTLNAPAQATTITLAGPQGTPGAVQSVAMTSTGGTITITGATINAGHPTGTFNVDLPQSVATSATPTFAGLTLNGGLNFSNAPTVSAAGTTQGTAT